MRLPIRILVADDSPPQLMLLRTVFKKEKGYQLRTVKTTDKAWEVIEKSRRKPLVVVLDWKMPGRIGALEICKMVKKWESKLTSIIIFSGKNSHKNRVMAIEAGADDYLVKTGSLELLEAYVHRNWGEMVRVAKALKMIADDRKIASQDKLTGLWNHGAIIKKLERETKRAVRRKTTLATLFIDLDGFKSEVNDRFGHVIGNIVLVQVAKKIQDHLRLEDEAGRYGGDEFLLVLRDCSSKKAFDVAERLVKSFSDEPIEISPGFTVNVTLSIGIAVSTERKRLDPHMLISLADEAMYHAKEAGGNTVRPLPVPKRHNVPLVNPLATRRRKRGQLSLPLNGMYIGKRALSKK